MNASILFCNRCGHVADKHAGSMGCIDRDGPGDDCLCINTYSHIVSTAPAAVKPQAQAQGDRHV